MLTKLEIHGFKSIRKLDELPLRNLNILIGPNGAGKSNLIDFFKMLKFMTSFPGKLQVFIGAFGGANTFLHDGSERTQQIKASLVFKTKEGFYEYAFRLSYAANDTLIFVEEKYRGYPSRLQMVDWISLDSGHKEARVIEENNKERITLEDIGKQFFDKNNPTAKTMLCLLRNSAVYQFNNTSYTAKIRNKCQIDDNIFLNQVGGNLAPFLYRLRENEQRCYKRIVETIRLIAPFFDDFVLEPLYDSILLRWREKDSDVLFSPSQASDGTLRAMALIAVLLQPDDSMPAIVILDEPELGLHPVAIHIIAGLLKSVSVNHQVIVATQSVTFVDQFDPEDIIVVDRIGRESFFKRLDAQQLDEWLEEYSIGELWEKNVIGGRLTI